MFLSQFNFPNETFSKMLQKHVLVKISLLEISYSIYSKYNRYLTNDVQLMLRKRVGA